MQRAHYTVLIGTAALLWLLILLIRSEPVSWNLLKPFSVVVSGVVLCVSVFDRWLWRWRVFKGWLVKRPIIAGTWRLELDSDWVEPRTGEGIGTVSGFVDVFQTYTALNLRIVTAESQSECIAAAVSARPDGMYEISAVYRNTPKATVRNRSEVHHGGMVLLVHGDPPTRIDGAYWTDRKTGGDLKLSDRMAKRYTSFDEAEAAFRDN